MWRVTPTRIHFRVKVAERGEYVLNNCVVTLQGDSGVAPPTEPAVVATAAVPPAAATSKRAQSKTDAPTSGGKFAAEAVFTEMKARITPDVVTKVNASFRFDITRGGTKRIWLADLKKEGVVREADDSTKADCIIAISDDDFVKLMNGQLNAQQSFMQGKIKIKGNMMLAQKLRLLASQSAKL